MNDNSRSKVTQVLGNTIVMVLYLFFVRSLLRGLFTHNIVSGTFGLVLLTFLIYLFIRNRCKSKKLSPSECYISHVSFSVSGILIAIFVPAATVFLLTRLPGTWSSSHLSLDYICAVTIPYIIDWGLSSGINEEMVFRGYLLKVVEQNYGKKAAVIYTSLVFGALHLANGPLTAMEMILFFAYTSSIGILLACITLKSGSIWNSVLVHALINTEAVLVTVGHNTEFISPFVYTFSDGLPAWLSGGENFSSLLDVAVIWAAIILYLGGKYISGKYMKK